MNEILQLKGRFEQKENKSRGGGAKFPKGKHISVGKLESLISDLIKVREFWENENLLSGALVSVLYNKIIAKSNRINGFLSQGSDPVNDSIVGAKFNDSETKKKHIITHYVPKETIDNTIETAQQVKIVLSQKFDGYINDTIFNDKSAMLHVDFQSFGLTKTYFQRYLADAVHLEGFTVIQNEIPIENNTIVTLFDTKTQTKLLLENMGIDIFGTRIIDEHTILLNKDMLTILQKKAPYLVAMSIANISELAPTDSAENGIKSEKEISLPENEAVIGVIDTMFDSNVYFSDWVQFENKIDEDIPLTREDYNHGTAVSSIIVDGPTLNPDLDDGCGRFRVRQFGVATNSSFNSFTIIRAIKEIIVQNPDIRVWNLSLGANQEINENFISAEGAVLDTIQFENDVIFVVAGTNKLPREESKRIGSPADSINSMTVNSVKRNQEPTEYTREGKVLSFFVKPDVSYYGGSTDEEMYVVEPKGIVKANGTSFAAPWIARKLAYMIEIIGLTKEEAKALLIDSAIGWSPIMDPNQAVLLGHGVVPIHIDNILKSPNDEIRFIVSGSSEKYDTYNYTFPVPINQDKYPYISKATMCYFPRCSRNQGVDYTNTELDIYFGRIDNKGNIRSINKNKQSIEVPNNYLYEEDARKIFRKWDNVKHITELVNPRTLPKKVYDNPLWGMSIKTKERLKNRDGEGIRFGVVVTLKEINGVNRIEDFIQQCSLKGWLVNRIDIQNRIDIYNTVNEDIEFD